MIQILHSLVRVVFTLTMTTQLGCALHQTPVIRFLGIEQTESTREALTIEFKAEIENPNPEPIEIHEVNYELLVSGDQTFRCRRDPLANLPAYGRQEIVLPAVIPYSLTGITQNQPPLQAQYELRGFIQYLPPGEIALVLSESGIHRPNVEFSDLGSCRLSFAGSSQPSR